MEGYQRAGAKNVTFCAIYTQKRSFYRDRLGTNIGKALQKRVAFSCRDQSDRRDARKRGLQHTASGTKSG
jgi:hypothetical protein